MQGLLGSTCVFGQEINNMPKASIEINDDFVFRFSKYTVGSEETIREIPEFVKLHFINNVGQRIQLKDEVFLGQYRNRSRTDINTDTSSLFLAEIELSFSGKKIGGIGYAPVFTSDSKFQVNFIETVGEDEQDVLLKFNVVSSLFWDFKSSDLNKLTSGLEWKESTWEKAKIELRINFRNNFLAADTFVYDSSGNKLPNQPFEVLDGKLKGIPEDESNLGFILEIMPNVFSIVKSVDPETQFELNNPYFQKMSSKNIHMKSKYLNF
jgi:hypothetical protein